MTEKQIFRKLEIDNKYTLPKIRTGKIFLNNVDYPPKHIREEADVYFKNNKFKKLPNIYLNVRDIFPTQDNLTIKNLELVKGVSQNTDAYLCEVDGKYYVLDGHHRIAMNILRGFDKIKAFIYSDGEEYSIGGL